MVGREGLIAAVGKVPKIFGVDGHFKPYFGKEPIDKGGVFQKRVTSSVLVPRAQVPPLQGGRRGSAPEKNNLVP